MRPCKATSARRCCNCRARRNQSPHWSSTWNATRNLYCAANRETRPEITVDLDLPPQSAVRVRDQSTGSFLHSERASARDERPQGEPPDSGIASRDIAERGGSPRNSPQYVTQWS